MMNNIELYSMINKTDVYLTITGWKTNAECVEQRMWPKGYYVCVGYDFTLLITKHGDKLNFNFFEPERYD